MMVRIYIIIRRKETGKQASSIGPATGKFAVDGWQNI